MTNTEKEAEYIKKQRIAISKMVAEICVMCFNYNTINYKNKAPYGIQFEVCTFSNTVILRIADNRTCSALNVSETTLIDCIFEGGFSNYTTKTRIAEQTKAFKADLRKMKAMAKKYIDLNVKALNK